jgi:hypothetical protein
MKSAQPPGNPHTLTELLDAPEFDFATRAYAHFSEHLDVQLIHLVAKWQHLAAPRALFVGRTCSTIRTPE